METTKSPGYSLMTDGIFSFFAGIALLFLTGISEFAIVVFAAIYAMGLGIVQMIAARGEREPGNNISYLTLLGLYSVVAGVALLFFTDAALTTIIALVAAYVAITGVAEMIASYQYRAEMGGYAWFFGSGTVRFLFAIVLVFSMNVSLSTLIVYLALYSIVEGLVTYIFGYEVSAQIGKWHQRTIMM